MIIDTHCHVSPLEYPAAPPGQPCKWPCMQGGHDAATLYLGEDMFRKLDARSWDVARRVEDMERDGISVQVLSPLPELLSYWLPLSHAEVLADSVNNQIASMVATAPARLRGLGAVPLQDVDFACRYLERIAKEFRLSGVEVGSNVNGVLLGDPRFEPFFETAAALSLSVFVHALHPIAGKPEGSNALFAPLAGFSLDVGMSVASILLDGLIERHPTLRLAFSHGGGAVTGLLGRLDTGWDQTAGFNGRASRRPSEQVKALYFDSNIYDAALLRFLCESQFPGRVMVGTDYPYIIMQRAPAEYIASAGMAPEALESLQHGCARRFLGEA